MKPNPPPRNAVMVPLSLHLTNASPLPEVGGGGLLGGESEVHRRPSGDTAPISEARAE